MSAARLVLPSALGIALVLAAGAAAVGRAAAADDPTRPPRPAVAGAPVARAAAEPVLSAIFVSDARRIAVLDGRPLREGEAHAGLVLEAVLADRVRYRRAGVVRELRLAAAGAPVKQPSRTAPAPGVTVP